MRNNNVTPSRSMFNGISPTKLTLHTLNKREARFKIPQVYLDKFPKEGSLVIYSLAANSWKYISLNFMP